MDVSLSDLIYIFVRAEKQQKLKIHHSVKIIGGRTKIMPDLDWNPQIVGALIVHTLNHRLFQSNAHIKSSCLTINDAIEIPRNAPWSFIPKLSMIGATNSDLISHGSGSNSIL